MAGPDVIEGDQHVPSVSDVDMFSIVTLNVDGLGDYSDTPDVRMGAIISRLLVVEPDLLALQEVTMPMLTRLQQELPEWHVRRMRSVSEDYFNVIATREPMEARSFPYPSSMKAGTWCTCGGAAGPLSTRMPNLVLEMSSEMRGSSSFCT
jgi:hypothetical protein